METQQPKREHGSFEVVDGVPTVWVRIGGPDGPLMPVRTKGNRPVTAVDSCRGLGAGSTIVVEYRDGGPGTTTEAVTVQRPRENDADPLGERERLMTSGGTLRWHAGNVAWWPRCRAGEEQRVHKVVSVAILLR